ncbi:hypothetical protein [Mesorhizobium sp. M1378]|uniref:hypothetical protein n=1 Tax=Mesorhizobium sp. M1378 TaxID=2957092 RepID=UPI00333CEFCC
MAAHQGHILRHGAAVSTKPAVAIEPATPAVDKETIERVQQQRVLPSEEAVLGLYGPLPIHEAEALAKAIIDTVGRLVRD